MLRIATSGAAAAFLLLAAASCNKDSNDRNNSLTTPQQLVAAPWTTDFQAMDANDDAVLNGNETQPIGLATYTFRENNTGRITGSLNGQQSSLDFTWQLLDNNRLIRIQSSQGTDTGFIQTLSNTRFVVKYGIENVRWMGWKR